MRFFDAHCDTIGKIVEKKADFTNDESLHVTLPGMRAAGMGAQVFAVWAWHGHYRGEESEAALRMVRAVRDLCAEHSDDLLFATTGAQIADACAGSGPTVLIAGLEGSDPLGGEVDALRLFCDEGVRLLTLAWADTGFCGSVFGSRTGLTPGGRGLIESCEDLGVVVDVSHASDAAFADVCALAARPFIASHSNCRSLCPNPRNLTDQQIRILGERGGVMGINLGSGFLSREFHERTLGVRAEFFRSVEAGEKTFDEAGALASAAVAGVPRPPLSLVVEHVRWAVNVGGEDCVGLGGDLDGVDSTPLGLDGVGDYPRIAELLANGGLSSSQVDKVCRGNFVRVFEELLR